MAQKANVLQPSAKRRTYQVTCFRDGNTIMRLQVWSESSAQDLAASWDQGYTQGQIAEKMKAMGMALK